MAKKSLVKRNARRVEISSNSRIKRENQDHQSVHYLYGEDDTVVQE
jgi:hypothetical protein